MMRESHSCDVVIIGGGLAGLCAARVLAAEGVNVRVLEAQGRVGGRTLTERGQDGSFIDHGGQWVSPRQDRIVALANELGIELFPTWDQGLSIDWRDSLRCTYSGPFPPADMAAAPEVHKAASMLADMAAQVPLEAPWTAPQAGAWDHYTLDEWLASHVHSPGARRILARSIQGVFTDGPGKTSLLAALFWIRSGDPLVPFLGNADHGPERRFVGGAQQLSERMALALGTRVILGVRVSHITYGPSGLRVSAETVTVSAQRAIITLPPAIAGRLHYTPALPAARDQLTQRTPMGWLIKVHAAYPTRFWVEDGLSGQVTSDAGAIRVCVDNSPASGSPGILAGFIEGAEARRLAVVSREERRAAVLDDFVKYFGAKASRPEAYYEKNWGDDEFTRGAEGGYWTQGIWTTYGHTLRTAIGPLHWAGTETSAIWNGKMEGAVRSGERAAAEVLAALRGRRV